VANSGGGGLSVHLNSGCATQELCELSPPALPETALMCSMIPLELDAGEGYASYEWSTGETTRSITVRPLQPFLDVGVRVSDETGCSAEAWTHVVVASDTTSWPVAALRLAKRPQGVALEWTSPPPGGREDCGLWFVAEGAAGPDFSPGDVNALGTTGDTWLVLPLAEAPGLRYYRVLGSACSSSAP
jgi:hypothetical protein